MKFFWILFFSLCILSLQAQDPSKDRFYQIEEALKHKDLVSHYDVLDKTDFEKGFDQLPNLEILALSDYFLEEIPAAVFKLNKLKRLNIRGANLKEIPKAVAAIESLEVIYVSSSKRELPGLEYLIEHAPNLKEVVLDPVIISEDFIKKMGIQRPSITLNRKTMKNYFSPEIRD